MKDVHELEDSILIGVRLQRWETAEKLLRRGYILGIAAALTVLVLVFLGEVTFSWFVSLLVVWSLVFASWGLAKFQVDKLGARLHNAEFQEEYHAISRKYQERRLSAGHQD